MINESSTNNKNVKADKPKSEVEKTEEVKDFKQNDNKQPEQKDQKKTGSNTSKLIIGFVLVIIIVAIAGLALIGFGFYKWDWKNQFTESIVNTLGLPVAVFDSKVIAYKDYQGDLNTLNHFYSKQAEQNPGLVQIPPASFLEKSVLSRMIREMFLADAANEFGLTVSQAEIDEEFNKVVTLQQSEGEIEQTLNDLYNWTTDEFKMKVLQPFLVRLKIQDYITSDDTINADAKIRANDVLALVEAGDKTFEELATEYSEDTSATVGGDLGYFTTGQMVPEFENAVLLLSEGEVSGIVQSQFGFHIIKLTERIPASDESPEQFRASHILIKTSNVDDWTNEQLASKKVSVWLKGLEWKEDCGLVLGASETCDDNELIDVTAEQAAGAAPLNTVE